MSGMAGVGRIDAAPVPVPVQLLVVDDNAVNLLVMSALLAGRDLVPVLAEDGAQAVALACARRFDLILMDLQMPVLDGFGATLAIRRFEALHAREPTPVLAYSSLAPEAEFLSRLGLSGRLNKPCSHDELESCLLRWCPTYRPLTRPGASWSAPGTAAASSRPPPPAGPAVGPAPRRNPGA
jgi:CheY-like chemotaxis protein